MDHQHRTPRWLKIGDGSALVGLAWDHAVTGVFPDWRLFEGKLDDMSKDASSPLQIRDWCDQLNDSRSRDILADWIAQMALMTELRAKRLGATSASLLPPLQGLCFGIAAAGLIGYIQRGIFPGSLGLTIAAAFGLLAIYLMRERFRADQEERVLMERAEHMRLLIPPDVLRSSDSVELSPKPAPL